MLHVQVERVTGLLEALEMLTGIESRAQNYEPLLDQEMTDEAHQFFVDQFATQGAAGGSPWLPLSPFTERIKAELGYGGKGILRRTDELYNSLTQRDAPLGARDISPDSLEAGTEDPKAILHQEGYGRLPQRQIVPDEIPDAYTNKWDELVLDYVEGA